MNSIEKLTTKAQALENRLSRRERHWPKNPLKLEKALLEWDEIRKQLIDALRVLIASIECRDDTE